MKKSKRVSKRQAIKAALLNGAKISALDAWKICRTFGLAEIVRDLRKAGMRIKAEFAVENGCRFAIYHLEKMGA